MQSGGSLLSSEETASGPCPKPDKSRPYHTIYLKKEKFRSEFLVPGNEFQSNNSPPNCVSCPSICCSSVSDISIIHTVTSFYDIPYELTYHLGPTHFG
jgi:hypothetical protein